jgi:formylglycine-generating enzyme required for sulfatase activity
MIRFVYPNVDQQKDLFIGTGAFIASSNNLVDDNHYEIRENLHLSKKSDIITAANILSRNAPHKETWNVYSHKNDKHFFGDSMRFAYLMALINCHCPLKNKWKINADLWFTGSPFIGRDNMPSLEECMPNFFKTKLIGFIQQTKDPLFFISLANLNTEYREICLQNNVNLLTIQQFCRLNPKKILNQKRVITVDRNSLPFLVDTIFKTPLTKFQKLKKIIQMLFSILLLIIGYYGIIFLNNLYLIHTTEIEAKSFFQSVKTYFKDTIAPACCDKTHLPPNFMTNPDIQYIGSYILSVSGDTIGKMGFSHIKSDTWIIMDKNGQTFKQDFYPANIPSESINIVDLVARIEAEKYYLSIQQSNGKENKTQRKSYIPNNNVIINGRFKIGDDGTIKGQKSFSHIRSDSTFTLFDDGHIEYQKPDHQTPIEGMIFVWIPGGCFNMGCNPLSRYDCSQFETFNHVACIDGFWMGKTEITQAQWKKIMNHNPAAFSDCENCPVESISWIDIQTFIQKLNTSDNVKGMFRLPSEAEWEYACTSCGDVIQPKKNQSPKTYPVCLYGMNTFGLCDMSGNVLEMCQDTFFKDAYQHHWLNNPLMIEDGTDIVLRGGDFSSPVEYSPCEHRSKCHKNEHASHVGFRLVWINK